MIVRDMMSTDVKLVSPDTTIKDAACIMRDNDFGFLPVGENDRLVGCLTDRDITIRVTAEGIDPSTASVRDAMSDKHFYCFEDQEASEACDIMEQHLVRRLPVLNREKRMVGIVSLGDVAIHMGSDTKVAEALQQVSQHH